MKAGRIRTLVPAAVVLLASMLPATAGIREIRMFVEGVACPFCSFGIEKNLKKVAGVLEIETTIKTGEVRILWDPVEPIDPKDLRSAVRKAGFTPKSIEADIHGELSVVEGVAVLRADRTGQLFALEGKEVEPGRTVLSGTIVVLPDGLLSLVVEDRGGVP